MILSYNNTVLLSEIRLWEVWVVQYGEWSIVYFLCFIRSLLEFHKFDDPCYTELPSVSILSPDSGVVFQFRCPTLNSQTATMHR